MSRSTINGSDSPTKSHGRGRFARETGKRKYPEFHRTSLPAGKAHRAGVVRKKGFGRKPVSVVTTTRILRRKNLSIAERKNIGGELR